jgi:diguanylate cyclase (GGDEF)-like protein
MNAAMPPQELNTPTPRAALRAALVDAFGDVVERDLFLHRVLELTARTAGRPWLALYTRGAAGLMQLRATTRGDATPAPARIALESDDVVEIMATPEHSALVAPIATHGAPFGALLVFSAAGERFSVGDREAVRAIVAELAPAIDVAEQHHALKQAAVVDQLTGAHTSSYLSQRLEQELARAQRGSSDLTVLLVSMPGFDAWHSQAPYNAVEERLRVMADALAAATRSFDVIAYQGDGTFAVVLPETDRDGAVAVIERVRAQLLRQRARANADAHAPTPMILTGLAAFPQDGDRGAALLLTAEHRLDEDRLQQKRDADA